MVIGVSTLFGDDQFTLFLREHGLQVDCADIELLFGMLALGHIRVGNLEANLAVAGLKINTMGWRQWSKTNTNLQAIVAIVIDLKRNILRIEFILSRVRGEKL